jgi:hypothetical protein
MDRTGLELDGTEPGWNGIEPTGMYWTGLDGAAWTVFDLNWTGLNWAGLELTGLECPELDWMGLQGPYWTGTGRD